MTLPWDHPYARHLRDHPLCIECAKSGRITVATLATKFDWYKRDVPPGELPIRELRSLCRACHASGREGWLADYGDDGYPLDENHPWYRGKGF
jgi:hypothetical protein